MADRKRPEPYKPLQPQIPGVSLASSSGDLMPASPQESAEKISARKSVGWIAGVTVAFILFGVALLWQSYSVSPAKVVSIPASVPASTSAQIDIPNPVENLPVGPGVIATTDELTKPWSARHFLFHNPLTSENVPAMVVRLPGGGYWGFSLREPYGKCDLELIADMQKLETDYNFHATHPMLGDPCNHTVFDLTRYGSAPSGLVRGEIAQGSAIRPPIAIEITTHGNQVLAVRSE